MSIHEAIEIMKTKNTIIDIICILLITLWIYTAMSKLMDFAVFKVQLSRQAFISGYATLFAWLLPLIELVAAMLLMFSITRKAGLLLSFSLMTVFTAYIGMIAFGIVEKTACSCGGVLSSLGFKEHFWFNLFFLALSGLGLYLNSKINLDKWKFLIHRRNVFRPN